MNKRFLLSTDIIALVPSAGIGTRMQVNCLKQYLTIGKFTLLEHSVACLLAHPAIKKVVVAISINDTIFDHLMLSKDPRVFRVIGGNTRAESVLACLQFLHQYKNWVLVHDAVRPCLHLDDLSRLIKMKKYSRVGAILASPVQNTVKFSEQGNLRIASTLERKNLWNALTPQFFPSLLLKDCLTRALNDGITITDESSALEYCGYHPLLVSGRSSNIKVTKPEDLEFAAFYLQKMNVGVVT